MEFLTQLEERELGDKTALRAIFEPDNMHRMHKGIQVGPYVLSIQASYYHYCSPRITMETDLYSEMEMAVIKDNEFISIVDDENFKDFEQAYLIHDSWDAGVYAYVDVQLIEGLYQYLKTKFEGGHPHE
ncbi:hypothetical protein M3204_14100 [Mesobacillus subterraneus]|uniref:hypothetical protein n=1 Tax=Mesobacillus subterraneus TaxID=285983 RepID=UPI00203EC8BC|nr:hypothetical protein [Mesobacillus subterraneus]MCM3665546.1 hypothetical protein [Mesobacillus subterraneus]MCM3686105.1 hypothetical protein [Mesobacillus subterraneus]